MLSCWNKDRVKRPKFRSVRETIDKWIRNTELLKQDASVVKKVYVPILIVCTFLLFSEAEQ